MTENDESAVDIFLSYAREDRGFAGRLATRLEAEGFRVWWDFELIGGQDYRSEIADAIDRAAHVVVLWSKSSVGSHFVIDEAGLAKKQGKLVPVLIDDASPPLGFGALHSVNCRDPDTDAAAIVAALRFRPLPSEPPVRLWPRRRLLGGLAGVTAVGAGVAALDGLDKLQPWLDRLGLWKREDLSPSVQRLALVIGNNAYENVLRLDNAVNDATAVGSALKRAGFSVGLLVDSSGAEFREAIRHFKILLSLGGVGVFYYAGHAAHIAGRDYVLPVDAPGLASADDFVNHSIEITEVRAPIRSFFSAMPMRVNFAGLQILGTPAPESTEALGWHDLQNSGDAGASSGTERAVPAQEDHAPQPENKITKGLKIAPPHGKEDHGVMTVYSAGLGEVAFDGIGNHSPFAEALIREIGVGDGDVVRVARRVRQHVIDQTDEMQNPILEDGTTRDFFFNLPDRDPRDGVLRLVFLDSCRDNPFEVKPELLTR